MAALASIDDLQTLMGTTFTGDTLDQANMVLSLVSAWAISVSGQVNAWPDAPVGVPPDVQAVVLTASRRELRNPDRISGKTTGPFMVSYSQMPTGFFTEAELDILRQFRSKGSGLFTVSTTRGEYRRRMPWFIYWDLAFGDATASWEPIVEWLSSSEMPMDAGMSWVTGQVSGG